MFSHGDIKQEILAYLFWHIFESDLYFMGTQLIGIHIRYNNQNCIEEYMSSTLYSHGEIL